jgi:pro-sigmaK processing inhibitor BofA
MFSVDPIIMIFIGICIIMLFWVLAKDMIMTIIIRSIVGILLIIFINSFVPVQQQVGINFISILCSGALGIPGVVMLYILNYLI